MIHIKSKNILTFLVLFLSFFLSSCNKSIDSGTLYKQSIESIVELKAFNNSEDISPRFEPAHGISKGLNFYFDHYHPNRSGSEKAHVWFGTPVY